MLACPSCALTGRPASAAILHQQWQTTKSYASLVDLQQVVATYVERSVLLTKEVTATLVQEVPGMAAHFAAPVCNFGSTNHATGNRVTRCHAWWTHMQTCEPTT